MLSFRAVISYYLILFRPIAALQVAAIKNLFHFYSSPVALGQIYYVLVLISTNHNARYLDPEIDISRTLKEKDNFTSCSRLRFKILTPELLVRFAYPSYKKQNASGKTTIAVFSPLTTLFLKGISRICFERLWRQNFICPASSNLYCWYKWTCGVLTHWSHPWNCGSYWAKHDGF